MGSSQKLETDKVQIMKSHLDEVKSIDEKKDTISTVYSKCKSFANAFERITKGLGLGTSTIEVDMDGNIEKLDVVKPKKNEGKNKKTAKKSASKKDQKKVATKKPESKPKAKTSKPKKAVAKTDENDVGNVPDEPVGEPAEEESSDAEE